MKKVNRKAGFWIRLLSTLIDVVIFCILGILSSLMCIAKVYISEIDKSIYLVSEKQYLYILWLLLLIIFLIIQFMIIPYCLNCRTIGMVITKLEVDFKNSSKSQVLLKKIEIGPMLWIILIILFMCFVWPNTINKMVIFSYIKTNYNNVQEGSPLFDSIKSLLEANKWTIQQTIFYSIPSVISPLIVIVQLFFLISVGFKKSKEGLIDKFTSSQVVYKNKFDEVFEQNWKIIEPEKNIKQLLIWKE